MCNERLLTSVEKIAKSLYSSSFDHGLPHVERVYKWSFKIVEEEKLNVNTRQLSITVLLHDTGRYIGEPHAYYSVLLSEELLKEAECSNTFISEVVSAIASHSYSYSRKPLQVAPLAKILSDADKLDALGVVGFLRVFIYGERHGRSVNDSINHFYDKILKLHELMNYSYSKRVSAILTKRVEQLLEMLYKEMEQDVNTDEESGNI